MGMCWRDHSKQCIMYSIPGNVGRKRAIGTEGTKERKKISINHSFINPFVAFATAKPTWPYSAQTPSSLWYGLNLTQLPQDLICLPGQRRVWGCCWRQWQCWTQWWWFEWGSHWAMAKMSERGHQIRGFGCRRWSQFGLRGRASNNI